MIAIFPGSFGPFHHGHFDIVKKLLTSFDEVFVVHMKNPEKNVQADFTILDASQDPNMQSVTIFEHEGTLKSFVDRIKRDATMPVTIVRGLRNQNDFLYEQTQQYWNEDLGVEVPFLYMIADRKLVHVSSSAVRAVNALKGIKE